MLLLLAFAGQALAGVEPPCAGMRGSAGSTIQHGDHHGAHQQTDAAGSATSCDCCQQLDCLMVHCVATPAALAAVPAPGAVPARCVFLHNYSISYAALNRDTPFRPPIIR